MPAEATLCLSLTPPSSAYLPRLNAEGVLVGAATFTLEERRKKPKQVFPHGIYGGAGVARRRAPLSPAGRAGVRQCGAPTQPVVLAGKGGLEFGGEEKGGGAGGRAGRNNGTHNGRAACVTA